MLKAEGADGGDDRVIWYDREEAEWVDSDVEWRDM